MLAHDDRDLVDAHVSAFICGGAPPDFYRWDLHAVGARYGARRFDERNAQAALDHAYLVLFGIRPRPRDNRNRRDYVRRRRASSPLRRCAKCREPGHNARSH